MTTAVCPVCQCENEENAACCVNCSWELHSGIFLGGPTQEEFNRSLKKAQAAWAVRHEISRMHDEIKELRNQIADLRGEMHAYYNTHSAALHGMSPSTAFLILNKYQRLILFEMFDNENGFWEPKSSLEREMFEVGVDAILCLTELLSLKLVTKFDGDAWSITREGRKYVMDMRGKRNP